MTIQANDSINLDRIKDRLRERAFFYKDRNEGGFPRSVSFANERVQTSNRNTDTFVAQEVPAHIKTLDKLIDGISTYYRQVLVMEYSDNRPQKSKAQVLGITREVYSERLKHMYIQLDYALFGNHQSDAEVRASDYRLAYRLCARSE
jgi:hypothetical protein